MVIRKKGSVFFIDGKEFKIGGGVFAMMKASTWAYMAP